MRDLQAAVVAVGAQGCVHLHGYRRLVGVHVAAVTDIDVERAQKVAAEVGATSCGSYGEILEGFEIDLLSICTPPAMHEQIVLDAVASGVRAIHCEKPMAMTYAGARRMHEAARDGGTLLSINHQRRWDPVYRGARDAIRAGEIGEVESLEGYCANLFDWGSHLVDLILFFCEDERPAQVFGQIDVAERRHVYGALIETASVTYLHWADGRNAAVFTGRPNHLTRVGHTLLTVQGTDGRLEVTSAGATVRRFDGGCRVISPVLDPEHDVALGGVEPAIIQATALALEDLVQCLETGRQPLLSSAHGLNAAEIIFATYESSATRRPVDLPLGPVDNPLHRGLELGYWSPVGESYGTS